MDAARRILIVWEPLPPIMVDRWLASSTPPGRPTVMASAVPVVTRSMGIAPTYDLMAGSWAYRSIATFVACRTIGAGLIGASVASSRTSGAIATLVVPVMVVATAPAASDDYGATVPPISGITVAAIGRIAAVSVRR
jgi:hypothetical protein